MEKLGVFLCSGCGIGDALDLEAATGVADESGAATTVTHECLCGAEGLETIKEGLLTWEVHEANIPGMLAAFGIQPGDVSPAQFIQRVMNPYDDVSFIQKEKPIIADAPDENRVMYKVRSCSVADTVNREYPGLCRLIMESALEGQRRAAKANVKVTWEKFLCEGADACEFYVEKIKE